MEVFDEIVLCKNTCISDQSIFYITRTLRQIFGKITDHGGTDKKAHLKSFKVLKRCKQSELYSLESTLVEEEQSNLKKQKD